MNCVFCKIVSGQIPTKKIKETSHSISFLDTFPLAKGHVLVIPKQHHKKIQDMTKENSDLFSLVHEVMSKVDAVTGSTLLAIHNGKMQVKKFHMCMCILFQDLKMTRLVQYTVCSNLYSNCLNLKSMKFSIN